MCNANAKLNTQTRNSSSGGLTFSGGVAFGPKGNTSTMFCKAYQAGKCTKQSPHNVNLGGKKFVVSHICATCWIVEKLKREHPESSHDCKYYGKSMQEAKESFK